MVAVSCIQLGKFHFDDYARDNLLCLQRQLMEINLPGELASTLTATELSICHQHSMAGWKYLKYANITCRCLNGATPHH